MLTLISFSPNFKLQFKICYEQHNINLIKFIILIYSGSAQFFFIDKPFIFLIFNICWILINLGAQSIVCNNCIFIYVSVCNLIQRRTPGSLAWLTLFGSFTLSYLLSFSGGCIVPARRAVPPWTKQSVACIHSNRSDQIKH